MTRVVVAMGAGMPRVVAVPTAAKPRVAAHLGPRAITQHTVSRA